MCDALTSLAEAKRGGKELAVAFALVQTQVGGVAERLREEIGALVARAFTAPILIAIAHAWALMLVVVATTVIAGATVGYLLAKYGHLPGSTAAWVRLRAGRA